MDGFRLVLLVVLAFGSYFLGRYSTQGASWESAFNTVNKACDNWRKIAEGWEEEARRWKDIAEGGA